MLENKYDNNIKQDLCCRYGSILEEMVEIPFSAIEDGFRRIEKMVEGEILTEQDSSQDIPGNKATVIAVVEHADIAWNGSIQQFKSNRLDLTVTGPYAQPSCSYVHVEDQQNKNEDDKIIPKNDDKIIPKTYKQTIKNKKIPQRRLNSRGSLPRIDF